MQINNRYGNTTTNWNQASSNQMKKNTNTSNPLNENKHSFGNVILNSGVRSCLCFCDERRK